MNVSRDLVARAREELVEFDPRDARAAASKDQIVRALDMLPAPLDEHADLTHVTGSAVVVGRRGVVLLVHRRLGRWMQPGGHLEPGESPADGAVRESIEETGLAVRHPDGGAMLVHVDVHEAARGHVHLDLRYLLVAPDDDPAPPAGESQQVQWFSWEDADGLADESLRGALATAHERATALGFDTASP
ncbi:MAG: NUDIX domain-containing protein [Acidimicrobiia bacterium]